MSRDEDFDDKGAYRNTCPYGLDDSVNENDYGNEEDLREYYVELGSTVLEPQKVSGNTADNEGVNLDFVQSLSEEDAYLDMRSIDSTLDNEDESAERERENFLNSRSGLDSIELELINRLNSFENESKLRSEDTLTYKHMSCLEGHTLHGSLLETELDEKSLVRLRSNKGLVSCSSNSKPYLFTEMYLFNAPIGHNHICYGGVPENMRKVIVSNYVRKNTKSIPLLVNEVPNLIYEIMRNCSNPASRWFPDAYSAKASYVLDLEEVKSERPVRKDMFLVVSNGLVSSFLSKDKPFITVGGNTMERVSLTLKQSFSGTGVSHAMRNNQSCYLYPNVSQFYVGIDRKSFRPEFTGFLDPVNVSAGASGGCNRQVCPDVKVRVWSPDTYMSMAIVTHTLALHLSVCDCPREFRFRIDRYIYECCNCSLLEIAKHCASRPSHKDNCTLHYFSESRTMVLSYCPGALVRESEVGYVDNLMANGDYTLFSGPIVFEAQSRVCRVTSWCPFYQTLPEARVSLMEGFLTQAVCLPFSSIVATITPLYNEWPLCVTPELKVVLDACTRKGILECPLPGLNVRVVFMNAGYLTYEDAMVMSKSCAERFSYKRITPVTVSPLEGSKLEAGMFLEPNSKPYWAIPVRGKILSVVTNDLGKARLRIERLQSAVTGDKFTTMHGQKAVVTVLPDDEMPTLSNGFKAELIMGVTSLYKRRTFGQLLEAVCSQHFIDTKDNSDENSSKYFVCPDTDYMKSGDFHREAEIRINDYETGTAYFRTVGTSVQSFKGNSNSTMQIIKCNYGTIRLMQSPFMTNDKLQYTRVTSGRNTKISLKGKQAGGSIALGEMEIQQILGNGMSSVMKELTFRSDMVTIYKCNGCNCLEFLCDCDKPLNEVSGTVEKGNSTLISVRYSTIITALMIYQKDNLSIEFI